MAKKIFHYIYYCYFVIINKKSSHVEDGASSLTSMFFLSLAIAIYYTVNILVERQKYVALVEGFGIFFLGSLIWYFCRLYFIKSHKFIEIEQEFQQMPKVISIVIGIIILVLPLVLFVYTGIKMGNFIRSIQ